MSPQTYPFVAIIVGCSIPLLAVETSSGFLDDDAVRETLVAHTLKGADWIEHYTPAGEIVGKDRYFGVHDYKGRWSVSNGKVCYVYDEPGANTCSWLRRQANRVTHHHVDGRLKKDGIATRLSGNQVERF